MIGLIIGGAIGSSVAGDTTDDTAEPAVTRTVTETAAPNQPEPETVSPTTPAPPRQDSDGEIPGNGTFIVGTDIKPGTYRTDGPEDESLPNCYWARLSGTSGELDEIIANGNTEGPSVVTVSASDTAFQTNGCQNWKKTG